MLTGLPQFVTKEDSVRVYRIIGKGHVKNFGKELEYEAEDVVII